MPTTLISQKDALNEGLSECTKHSQMILYRIDMEDKTGTAMCRACVNDALDSGVFYTKS